MQKSHLQGDKQLSVRQTEANLRLSIKLYRKKRKKVLIKAAIRWQRRKLSDITHIVVQTISVTGKVKKLVHLPENNTNICKSVFPLLICLCVIQFWHCSSLLKYFDDVLTFLNSFIRLEWIRYNAGELCYSDIRFNIHDIKLLNQEVDYYSMGTETV